MSNTAPEGSTQPDMTGKVVIVTGGNSGIGKAAAAELAGMGARVIIAARSQAKGEAAIAEIRARFPDASVELVSLDLASCTSIRACATELLARCDRIDVLLLNAGLVLLNRAETADGLEMTFAVNHLGHFMLTELLRERIVASTPARIVVVSSGAHRSARSLDFDDLQATGRYWSFGVYAKSKLANIYFMRELARRLAGTGVTANALHPGFVATNFAKEGDTGLLGSVAMVLGRPFAISASKGARTSVFLCSDSSVAEITGEYWYKQAIAKPTKVAQDDAAAARLWDVSEKLVAICTT
jgi:NAD(P)-dependent dehydrogenase (short-subunit alcohol dehydrogenase family)